MNKRLIYAEDAIDAIEQLIIPEDMCVFEILSHIELAIGTLPSAQPEQPEDICGECDAWNKYKSEIKALPSEQTEHLVKESGNLVKGLVNDCISRQAAIDALCDNCDDVKAVCAHFPCKQCIAIEQLPSAQPEQSIAEWQKDFRGYINMLNIPRDDYKGIMEYINEVPSAQPEIIHCCDCIYYDPEHIEKNGVRYEYKDMPKDAFDVLGTGLVNAEYGVNVGGRCCRDYNGGYSEDKRVFVSEQNYCGRAWRRRDE